MAQDGISRVSEIVNQVDQTGDPYYNRFNSKSNRTAVLYVYDRALQNAELNEMQSIASHYLGALGNIIAKDGDRQQGMGYTQEGNNITVKDGLVYLAGKVRNFSQQTVSITGSGLETVGVRLVQSVITYKDDSNLTGLAPNQIDTNQAGADRLVETVELVANDDAAAPIYQFSDGKLYLATENSQLSKINDVVAKHDYDALGSYRVGSVGFALTVGKNITGKADYATASIAAGRAYVQGYAVDKPYATQLDIRKALDTEQIKNEQHIYTAGTDVYTLNLGNVKSIDLISAQVQDTLSVNHGTSGGSDYIIDNLVSIDSVYTSGSNGRVYEQGKDYNVQGNSITWNGTSGSQPNVGSSYMVVATYNKVLRGSNIDYITSISNDVDGQATIDFSSAKGDGSNRPSKPKNNGYITVTYTIYLYRTDLITLDRYGTFTIHEGTPARKYAVHEPIVNDPLTLTIGTINMFPNSSEGECNTTADTNLTFKDLSFLKRRIITLEYNEAINSLNAQEMQKHNPIELRGVYTDSFVDDIKFNSSYQTSSNVSEPFKADINMDITDRYITLPYTSQTPAQLIFNNSKSAAQMLSTKGHLLVAPFTEETMVEQNIVSSSVNINRYNTLDFEGILNLTPNVDTYRELQVTGTHVANTYYNRVERHGGFGDYYWHNTGTVTSDQELGYATIKSENKAYMREITVSFNVTGLAPYADNLCLYFAGIKCDIKPAIGYSVGSSVKGSIMALSDGSASGSFVIPPNIKAGSVQVELKSEHNYANTSYIGTYGIDYAEKVINRTITTYWNYDPVAESFVAPMDAQISSIDLKFAAKSNTVGVNVQLREMSSSGYPTSIVRATTYISPADIKVSSDGTVWTKAQFNDPVSIAKGESLAICVTSSSNDYAIWQGKMGEVIKGTHTPIYGNELYTAGVMFESSNNATWSVDQTSDIAFRVNIAKYTTEPCVALFDPMTDVKADEYTLLASYLTPANTGCTWEYRAVYENQSDTLDSLPWLPVTTGLLNDAGGILSKVQLRAIYKATKYVSPLLSLSSLVFGTYLSALRGDYVTLNINSSDSPFNRIYLSYLENTPSSSKVVPQYSLDEGHTWNNFTSTPSKTIVDGYGTKKVMYKETLSGSLGQEIMFHLKLTTTKESDRPRVSQFMSSWTQE
jgi:hypothetical protein